MADKWEKDELPDYVKTKKSLKRQKKERQEKERFNGFEEELENSEYELDAKTLNKLRRT